MATLPTFQTERLILRPFIQTDADAVQILAGDHDVAANLLHMPHPYEDGVAEAWIATHQEAFDEDRSLILAITLRHGGELIGSIGLRHINREHHRAELGYWIGKPYWNQGYITEAGRMIFGYGFEVMGLNKICALCFTRNVPSARVMQKLGMTHEGRLRQHVCKWGVFEDDEVYGILASEFAANKNRDG